MTNKTLEEQTAEVLEAAISPISPLLINTLLRQWQEHAEFLEGELVGYKIENVTLRQRVDRMLDVISAAQGLCCGMDWNNGTHARTYRKPLERAIKALALMRLVPS